MSKFQPGMVYMTVGVQELNDKGLDVGAYFKRHLSGDWGDLDEHDRAENEFALDKHLRLMSAYETHYGKIWIITEADRSSSTMLLPDEY